MQPNGEWIAGPDLPYPMMGGSICPIDDDQKKHVLVGGMVGLTSSSAVNSMLAWTHDIASPEVWTPTLNEVQGAHRFFTGCSRITLADGRDVVVLAGGQTAPDVDIYDISTNTWEPGPSLPAIRKYGSLLYVPATLSSPSPKLLFVGGTIETANYATHVGQTTVYELKLDLTDWIERTELQLTTGVMSHGTFLY